MRYADVATPKSWKQKFDEMQADGLTPLDLNSQNVYKYMDEFDKRGTSLGLSMLLFERNFKRWYKEDYLEGIEADKREAELDAVVEVRRSELKAKRLKREAINKKRRKNYKIQVSPGSLSKNRLWAS